MALKARTYIHDGVYQVDLADDYYARVSTDSETFAVCVHGNGHVTIHNKETHLHIKVDPSGNVTTVTPEEGGPMIFGRKSFE